MSESEVRNDVGAEVVRFWHTVEMFSPQSVPDLNPWEERFPVVSLKTGDQLPWDVDHRLASQKLRKDYTWQHTVYVGIYEIDQVFEVLRQVFEPETESFDARPAGQSALAAFTVSSEGRLLGQSEVLSMCGWGLGRARHPGPADPNWLVGFGRASELFVDNLTRIVDGIRIPADIGGDEDTKGAPLGQPITLDELRECLTSTVAILGVQDTLRCSEIRIASRQVKIKDANKIDGNDFLNSFIASDLSRVADQFESGNAGVGIISYLREDSQINVAQRVDVQERLDVVYDLVDPKRTSLGRWPSLPEHPLALSQQLAVNAVNGSLGQASGLFAVNGPPGTGKTTMLRDLVAAIVVERGCVLASLERPEDAFVGTYGWKTGNFTRTVQRWRSDLTGFEIVVASSNNGAVQNVSDEIPGVDAVAHSSFPSVEALDYFPDLATALLNVDRGNSESVDPEDSDVRKAWALAAGRLGNKSNRGSFVSALWFDEKIDVRTMKDRDLDQDPPRLGMQSLLKQMEKEVGSATQLSWDEAKAEFNAARACASRLLEERAKAHGNHLEVSRITVARDNARLAAADAERASLNAQQQLLSAQSQLSVIQVQRDAAFASVSRHLELKPGFLETLFTGGKRMRTWSVATDEYQTHLYRSEQALTEAQRREHDASRIWVQASDNAVAQHKRVHELTATLASLAEAEAEARQRWGSFAVDSDWWKDTDRRELQGLWLDPECNAARSEVFLAALRLHKAFLAQVPTQMRKSIHGAIDILSGDAPVEVSTEAALAAWQSLFFLVPVVSTTFASFDRVFSHLGKEDLGWLFIDEAGQAAPQQAVGAIWRSKRTIAVGDPLQLEPVVTIPFRAQQAIRKSHGVSETWLPVRTSVQALIDRLVPLGTWAGSGDQRAWVGAPLRVHRRCDEPMFSVVNRVAYDGLMVSGNVGRGRYPADNDRTEASPSAWIDVIGAEAEGHSIPEEHRVLIENLDRLRAEGQDFREVFVITPFRDVARRLHGLSDRYGDHIRYGTVHTAQGKEADIVFLVLGGNPSKEGAKTWAASKPNLINVAVSRAKRRLYVIGDRTAWASKQHFDTLAASLPVQAGSPER